MQDKTDIEEEILLKDTEHPYSFDKQKPLIKIWWKAESFYMYIGIISLAYEWKNICFFFLDIRYVTWG